MASKTRWRFQESLDNVDENIAQICHKHSIIIRTLYNVIYSKFYLLSLQRAVESASRRELSLSLSLTSA